MDKDVSNALKAGLIIISLLIAVSVIAPKDIIIRVKDKNTGAPIQNMLVSCEACVSGGGECHPTPSLLTNSKGEAKFRGILGYRYRFKVNPGSYHGYEDATKRAVEPGPCDELPCRITTHEILLSPGGQQPTCSLGHMACQVNKVKRCTGNGVTRWTHVQDCGEGVCTCSSSTYCFCQTTSCPAGWACKDSYTKAYLKSDCSWTDVTHCGFGNKCVNGQCVAEQTCSIGWMCKSSAEYGFRKEDCTWRDVRPCPYGCVDGRCETTPPTTIPTTIPTTVPTTTIPGVPATTTMPLPDEIPPDIIPTTIWAPPPWTPTTIEEAEPEVPALEDYTPYLVLAGAGMVIILVIALLFKKKPEMPQYILSHIPKRATISKKE